MGVPGFIINSLLLGVALSMDAVSMSIVNGMQDPNMSVGKKLKMSGVFGGFQMLMPLLGWVFVTFLVNTFRKVEPYIPWIAFFLLLFLGGKMVIEGILSIRDGGEREQKEVGRSALIVQGIATSIDALSVGFTISEYGFWMALAASAMIGAVTFVFCRIALSLGAKVGVKLSRFAPLVGGIILIGIGTEILLTNIL